MRRYGFLVVVFALAVLFFVYGTFASREIMKLSTVGLCILVILAVIASRGDFRFLSTKSARLNVAVASSNAFLFLIALLGVVFLWNIFIHPIQNIDFAIFGSMFLSVILMRLSIMQAVGNYLGKKP